MHARPFARPFARLPAPCPPPHPPPHTHTRHGPVRSSALLVRHLTPHSQQQPQRLRQRMEARRCKRVVAPAPAPRRRRRSSEEGEGQGGEQRRRLSVSLSHSLFGAEASVLVVIRIHGGCLAHTMCTVFATQRQQRHESQRMVSELPVRSQRLSLMWLYSPQNLTRKDVFHTTTASLSAPAARWPCAPCPSGGGGAVPCVGYQPLVAGGC